MKHIKMIFAVAALALSSLSAANAMSVTYNIPDAGKIVWEDGKLQVIDLQGDAVNYTLDTTVNDITLDNGDVNDIMIFNKDTDAKRQLILAHDKSKKMTVIMPVLNGKELSQWVVDDRYTTFKN